MTLSGYRDADECVQIVLASLATIGVDSYDVAALAGGAPVFGEVGLLDSFSLVMLVADLSEAIERRLGTPIDLLGDESIDVDIVFSRVNTIAELVRTKLAK